MDKWTFYLYLWTRLDAINFMLSLSLFASSIVFFVCLGIAYLYRGEHTSCEKDEEIRAKFKKNWYKWTTPFIILTILCILIPSQRDVSIIYYVPKIANSQAAKEASQIPADALKWLRLTLEQKINESTNTTTTPKAEVK